MPKHTHRGFAGRKHQGEHGRTEHRHYGQNSQKSNPEVVSPFGNMPQGLARRQGRQFSNPLAQFFGVEPEFGAGRKGRRQEARYQARQQAFQSSQAPLAQWMRQAGGFLPQVFGQAQNAGNQIASQAPGIFELLKGQVNTALGQLPGMQDAAAGQTSQAQGLVGQAQQMLREQQSPIASQALYQNALRQGIEGQRGAQAARGLLDAGSAQAGEEVFGRDLAAQFAQQQFANQQAAMGGVQGALGGVQNALGAQAGLLPLGAQLAGMQGQGLAGLQQALQAGYGMPMDALNQVFQQFAMAQNPQMALLGLTAPQVANRSSGGGFNVL